MLPTRHKTATVNGQEVFYREAGPSDAPVVVLLHGFPSSSHMFRHLVPALADDWDDLFAYATGPSRDTEPGARAKFSPGTTRWQYENGASDTSLVSPDTWTLDQLLLERPGNDEVQLALFRDYPTNIDGYPKLQEYFRTSQVPLLAVWGERDEIFGPDGARAFSRDLPDAEVHLLPAGHFALETHLDAISGYIHGFLGRVLT
ncbi:alpha/beta fold hydrolase [Actinacidiphila paucisporea]|uniref:Predicted esterase n=1 Tax=Actinacidiphila paucisporea TaxID=310782 RepID=A0A1M7QRZ4_9ACTN|nr:alpha/beta fold hydrolase [Actinacidiphila paucisporea]SHN34141.1 Predicted esterase [Actinacidiphila paucisporea]